MLAIVMANIGMFSYAAIILRKLQKNLRSGAVTRSYTTQRSYSTQMSQDTSENKPTLHRQYSRALSQGIDEVKSKMKKQKANAARFVINQCLLQSYIDIISLVHRPPKSLPKKSGIYF